MQLSVNRFNAQLGEMGQRMLWRRSNLCTCRDPHSGSANPECPVCDGKGVFWDAGVGAWAGVVGAKAMRAYADFGKWEDGDVLISIPSDSPLWMAGESDRVTFINGHEPFQVNLKRGATTLAPFTVDRVQRCFWLGPNGSALIDCELPRVDPVTRELSWADQSRAPDPGAQFTLRGLRKPEYFLWKEIPITRAHFNGMALPKRVMLKKFSLFGQ